MSRFIDSLSATLGQHLPGVVGALLVFLLGLLVAALLQAGVSRVLRRLRVDERLREKTGQDVRIAPLCGAVVFYLVLLYSTIIALDVLGIQGVLDPAKHLVTRVIDIVPNALAATFIAVAGYIIARIVSGAARVLVAGLDRFASQAGLGDDFKISRLVGLIVFIVLLIPVLISALDTLRIEAISGPATAMLNQLMHAVPKILGAAIILGVAYLIGRFVCGLLSELLKNLGADSLPAKVGAERLLGNARLSSTVGRIVLFFILLGAALSALETLELHRLSGVLDRLLEFSGQVVIGLLVIALGTVLANFAHRRLQRDGQPTVSSGIVRIAILGFVLALGLRAMGIGQDIVNLAFGLTLGAVAVAFALAFGLGGREAAGQQMAHWLARWRGEK
jgi:hypothetical protein